MPLLASPKGESHKQVSIINPRRAHALARVTVVVLSVCLSVRTKSASTRI